LNGVKLSSVPDRRLEKEQPRQPLERALVVRTALRLLNEVGLEGLTLRRLATELGVQAPALYWHFTNKRELLDHMAQAIGEECAIAVPDERRWDLWLADYARKRRKVLLSYRDGAQVALGNRPVPEMYPLIERAVSALVEVGFEPLRAMRNLIAVGTFVGGFVLEEQSEQTRNREEQWTDELDAQAFAAILGDGNFPTLAAALAAGGDPNGEASFEDGLGLIIDGMWAQLSNAETPS
jgi:TetR/AcrR family transcriptional regulator, tetracycline repressor protein